MCFDGFGLVEGMFHALCQESEIGVKEKNQGLLSVNGMRQPEIEILSPPKNFKVAERNVSPSLSVLFTQ